MIELLITSLLVGNFLGLLGQERGKMDWYKYFTRVFIVLAINIYIVSLVDYANERYFYYLTEYLIQLIRTVNSTSV